ncbi:MAG: diaminopimelate decarboxylase [Planctomycetaceae bacterium]|nr:diaminopimelate decarboxylase [Planctomycetaceae bacterium]
MPTSEPFVTSRTQIAGAPVRDLADRFGTPVYVYNAAKIVERVNDLAQFDVIRYAQKACSNIAILDLVRRHGVVVDAVSAGEVHRALAAGYKVARGQEPGTGSQELGRAEIVYTADIFDRESLDLVVKLGLPVNCGSPEMIDQLGERAPGRQITLRINPGFGHGHSQKTNTGGEQSKHGIWHEQLDDCLARADRHGLAVTGIHMHIGSGTDLHHLGQVCGALEKAAEVVGRSVTTISAGGGLPIPYRTGQAFVDVDQYFQLWDAARKRLEAKFDHQITLEIEPGRYLVAESGYLIAEIRAVKQMGGNTFYLLDAGFNSLARPILYGAYHPMSVCPRARGATAGLPSSADGPLHDVVVGGPLCESGDIFTQEEGGFVAKRSLPAAAVGDYLIIERAGAYGFVMASNYNSKPLPPEVLIQNGQAQLIRARQTADDLIRGEVIPK